MSNPSPSAPQWRARIADWASSGETVTAYCARHGLSRWTFYEWQRRLRRESSPPQQFLAVDVVAPKPAASGVELVLASGHRLRLERGFDRETLAAAVAALAEARPC